MKKIFIFNLIIIIFLIILGEIILRTFKLSQLMGSDSNIITFNEGVHSLTPNSSGLVFSKKVYIDKNKTRVPSFEFKYDKDKNIIFIGDSVTFGNGVEEENTFVGLLRKKYDDYNFYNTAVPGHDLLHHEKTLDDISKFKKIDKIIYVFTLNDVLRDKTIVHWNNRNQKKLAEELGFVQTVIRNKFFRDINFYLRNKSYIFMFFKGILTDPSKRWYANIKIFYRENKIDHLSIFLKKLIEFSQQKEAELYMIMLPYEFQTRDCKNNVVHLPQQKIKKEISKIKINFVDFYDEFCKFKNPKKLFYKYDPMHLSKSGHNNVLEMIEREVSF